ncbi:MAG TPA: hypothetical protein VG755_46185 [Nannocystaceae bacterium]|nr:hypothetical protein [Nannocystaceae bacterium]
MFGRPGLVHLVFSFAAASSLWISGCTCGSGPYSGDYFDGDRPGPAEYKYAEGTKGDPKVIGCADGQREAFADATKNPRIAGCVGNWAGSKSLRDKPTGKACGDDGEKCTVPADVCAAGWHVCGVDGKGEDLANHTNTKECDNAGPGRFNAALSHSPTDEINPCPVIKKDQVLPCVQSGLGSEPVCCGNDCKGGKCKDGVWKGKTKISIGTSEGCGAIASDRNPGILCCYDGEGNPAPEAKADAKAPDAKAEDTKAADTKADAKADDTKAADTKAADTKADTAKSADTKADAKTDDAKKEDTKKAG